MKLAITDSSSILGRTLTITNKPKTINNIVQTFNPQNEGEESEYTFNFFPTSDIEELITEIWVIFPNAYDSLLGYGI